MAKYTVNLRTYAHTSVEVEAGSPAEAIDASDSAEMPRICTHCAGWGSESGKPSLELSDLWEVSDVTDADGNVVQVQE